MCHERNHANSVNMEILLSFSKSRAGKSAVGVKVFSIFPV